jgi:hypothetical protein
MPTRIIARKPSSLQLPPEGTYDAVMVDDIDEGVRQNPFKPSKTQHRIKLIWQCFNRGQPGHRGRHRGFGWAPLSAGNQTLRQRRWPRTGPRDGLPPLPVGGQESGTQGMTSLKTVQPRLWLMVHLLSRHNAPCSSAGFTGSLAVLATISVQHWAEEMKRYGATLKSLVTRCENHILSLRGVKLEQEATRGAVGQTI